MRWFFGKLTAILLLVSVASVGGAVVLGMLLPSRQISYVTAARSDGQRLVFQDVNRFLRYRHAPFAAQIDIVHHQWSDDGQQLILKTIQDSGIKVIRWRGSALHDATPDFLARDTDWQWSSSQQQVMYTLNIPTEYDQLLLYLYINDAEGRSRRLIDQFIPGSLYPPWYAVWSPDDVWITFSKRYTSNISSIFLLKTADDSIQLVDVQARFPSWSPDSRHFVYVKDDVSKSSVMLVEPISGERREVFSEVGASIHAPPMWLADSQQIGFYYVDRNTTRKFILITLDGQPMHNLRLPNNTLMIDSAAHGGIIAMNDDAELWLVETEGGDRPPVLLDKPVLLKAFGWRP